MSVRFDSCPWACAHGFEWVLARQSTGREPGDTSPTRQDTRREPGGMLTQEVRGLVPAALTRRTHPAGSVTDPLRRSVVRPD